MSFISTRRLASLATGSALIATLAVASMPAATFAAGDPHLTGFFRDGRELTAAQIGGNVTGPIDAGLYDIGVYFDAAHPGSVTNADIHDAKYFGVVANGVAVNVANSKVHQIGEKPQFDGTQHGRAITFINGASGTISGNQVYDFQKNGITGEGPIEYIAQNGIVIRSGASATVKGNAVSDLFYNPETTEACGLLILDATRVTASSNTFSHVESTIYTEGTSKGHVKA